MLRTIDDLAIHLDRLGSVRYPSTGWYDHGPTRVVIDAGDGGSVAVSRFTGDVARLLIWHATFNNASTEVVLATIQATILPATPTIRSVRWHNRSRL